MPEAEKSPSESPPAAAVAAPRRRRVPGIRSAFLWASAAFTIFANGLLHGLAAGIASTAAALKAGASWKTAAYTGLGVAAVNGGKRVLVWSDANPFPNPFPGWVTPTTPATFTLSPNSPSLPGDIRLLSTKA